MSNIDFSQMVTADTKAEAARAAHVAAVKAECSRRIYAILDAPTVSNVQGAALAGELDQGEMAVFRAGRAWVDAMLSQPIQEDIPLQMFVYPVNPSAELPAEFVAFAEAPTDIADVDPDAIEANREAWIEAWTDAVLR